MDSKHYYNNYKYKTFIFLKVKVFFINNKTIYFVLGTLLDIIID